MIGTTRIRDTSGLTLIELMVATVLIAIAVLLAGRFIVDVVGQIGLSETQAQATEYALQETERLRLLPYDSVQAESREEVPGASGFFREVAVRDVGGGLTDLYEYRVVTVTVESPGVGKPVRVTTAVAAE